MNCADIIICQRTRCGLDKVIRNSGTYHPLPLDLLENVRVVECSAFIAAPLAGMMMPQFGADVIKVDMIGGPIDARDAART
jgi:hypothetical protein